MKNLIYIVFGFILGVVLCTATTFGNKLQKQADSITVIDTFIEYFTLFETETVYVDQIKEVPQYIPRTVVINDTTYIERIQQVYRDTTPSYNIEIGAVELNYYKLDVHHTDTLRFRDTIQLNVPIIEKKPKPKRWGLGIQTGVGYAPNNNNISPYIGVGISYNFIRF